MLFPMYGERSFLKKKNINIFKTNCLKSFNKCVVTRLYDVQAISHPQCRENNTVTMNEDDFFAGFL